MTELSKQTRIKIMMQLGDAINYQYAANVTEPLIYELVMALDEHYQLPQRYKDHLI